MTKASYAGLRDWAVAPEGHYMTKAANKMDCKQSLSG